MNVRLYNKNIISTIICYVFVAATLLALINPASNLDISLMDCLASDKSYYYDMTPVQELEDSCIPCSIEGLSIYEHFTLQKIEGLKKRIYGLERESLSEARTISGFQVLSGYIDYIKVSKDTYYIQLKRYKLLYYIHDKDGKKVSSPFMKNI
ncbi:MAG: hypothetical protein J6M65_12370 [Eubacterium sp.]|nr:hypothetical protein [Eubacterium sp.]